MKKIFKIINYRVSKTVRPLDDKRQDFLYSKISSNTKEKTLLIIKIDSIGDYVIFRNFLKEIKASEKFKDYKITLLGNLWYKDLAETFDKDSVDEFIWADHKLLQTKKYLNDLVSQIHKKGFEHAFCPNYSMSIQDIKLLARSGAKYKYCPKGDKLNVNPREKTKYFKNINNIIDTGERYDFEFNRYNDFFEKLLENKINTNNITLPLTPKPGNHIVICPGAHLYLRRWSENNFAQLIDKLNTESKFLIIGSNEDIEIAEKIKNAASSKNRISNLCGKITLVDVCKYISEAKLVITNDTGPYHMAMALNIQTICISNGNNYHRFTPYPAEFKKRSITVLSDKLDTLFQNEKESIKYQIKVSEENINEVGVEKVFNSIVQLFKNV